jgi:hypothetical protein
MVHRETTRVILDLFAAWELEGMTEAVTISNMADVTFELALQVIAAAGFGYNVAWNDEGSLPEGHTIVCSYRCWWSIALTLQAVIQASIASGDCQCYPARPIPRLGAWFVQEREGDSRLLQRVGGVYARDDSKPEGGHRKGVGAF